MRLRLTLAALCVLTCVGSVEPQVANNNAGWEMWMNRIYDLVAKNQDAEFRKRIQVVTLPRRAEWQTTKPFGGYQFCVFADSIPQLSAEYISSSSGVYENYQFFIDSLDIPPADPSQKTALAAARKSYNAERDKLDRLRNQSDQAWKQFDKDQHSTKDKSEWISYRIWYGKYKWGSLVGQQVTAVAGANQTYTHLLAKAYKGMQSVSKAVDNARNDGYVKDVEGDGGAIYHCANYGLSQGIDSFIDQSNDITLDFVSNKTRTHIESSSLSGGASISVGFFSFGGSGGGNWSRVDETKDKLDFKVTFKTLGRVSIIQGPWFSKPLLDLFRNGPFIPGSPMTRGKVWWPDGRFPWMPKEVVLAYQPAFTITLSASQYSNVKSAVSGGGGFGIGPFSFGASGGTSKQDISFDDQTNTITAKDTGDSPVILAVINEPLGQQQ